MFNITKKQISWNGTNIILETGKIGRQASASVVATMGETVVLCSIVVGSTPREGGNFLPLTVYYQEKFYAVGKIPGGFIKRETKPTDRETLVSRLIDRPIRPLFPEGYNNEVQITCTVLSYDGINDPDVLSIIGSSAALSITNIPLSGTIAAVRVGYKDGTFILNQSKNTDSDLDLVISGTKCSILMVESESNELSEEVMLNAVIYGHKAFHPIIDMIDMFAAEVKANQGNIHAEVSMEAAAHSDMGDMEIINAAREIAEQALIAAYSEPKKQTRNNAIEVVRANLIQRLCETYTITEEHANTVFNKLCKEIVRRNILEKKLRIDGRKPDDIRPISCEVDILPRVHGSALFVRGETQVLAVVTLGTTSDEQGIDDILGIKSERFMLHYNFPQYAVGEIGAPRAPGRREVGHGKLAFKALRVVLPSKSSFPYTIRLVSEVTESNGSSSMATVCGASLAMMAAGVPIRFPVSGIAMGLVKNGEEFVVLSDIMGDEDSLGDMDFKVAGTINGITALQMDIKVDGINEHIIKVALQHAKRGREHILNCMNAVLGSTRTEVSLYAPRITSMQINKNKIRDIIGAGGKVIRDICERSGAKIDIEDSGYVNIAATSAESLDTALRMINNIVAEPEVGRIYDGKVIKITSFGAFIRFLGSLEGLLHISEVASYHVGSMSDVLSEGDTVQVKVIGFDRSGKVRLSMRQIDNDDSEGDNSELGPELEYCKTIPEGIGKSYGEKDRGRRGSRSKSVAGKAEREQHRRHSGNSGEQKKGHASTDNKIRKRRFF